MNAELIVPRRATQTETPREAPEAAIRLEGVSKTFRRGASETLVLDRVELRVGHGECLFLVGPSGSGKTTLLSIIGCVLSPDCGDVRCLGCDTLHLDEEQKAAFRRRRLGFVFQRFHLVRGLNALENVALPLVLEGVAKAEAESRAEGLLARVGLGDRSAHHPSQLSVGQCQRVAIARALIAEPGIVLADEPTASLDQQSGQAALALLRELTVETGKVLIVVTHDRRILHHADRVLTLECGRVVEDANA